MPKKHYKNRGPQPGLDHSVPSGPRSPDLLRAWYRRTSGSILNYPLLLIVAACQFATLVISWPVWNARISPPLLPLLPFPAISFGIPLVISLLVMIPWPRIGVAIHTGLLLLAIIADQHRLQPQVISLAILTIGCLQVTTADLTRWYLIAMWLWAGLHKFLSAEWYGFQSWWFLEECGLDGDLWHLPFAIFVAAFEAGLGVLAMFKPKWAAWPAVALHMGLLVLLSPLVRNFNASVWPWNLATAAAAYWLLSREQKQVVAESLHVWLRRGIVTALLVGPGLFYVDLVNPHLAFVLYSGNMPRAIHVREDSFSRIDGWTGLAVPFPDSPWLFVTQFRNSAQPGERLHISDPRPGFDDRYFVLDNDRELLELSRDEFWQEKPHDLPAVPPLELEDAQLVWQLQQGGYELSRYDSGPIKSAVSVSSPAREENPTDPALIAGLPNLRELRWDDLELDDRAIRAVREVPRLEILELNNCRLPADTFELLGRLESLRWLQIEGGKLPRTGFAAFLNRPQVETLKLIRTDFGDEDLALIEPTSQLAWLDLTGTRITSQGLQELPVMANCSWLTLTDTAIDDDALLNVPDWPKLEVLFLTRTKITDRSVPTLCRVQRCQHLNVTGTAISPAGLAQLRAAFPAAVIEE
jgi:hypothetical protein